MSLVSNLRRVMPFALWQTMGFFRRIPSYWRTDRSRALSVREQKPRHQIYVTRHVSVTPPADINCFLDWASHGLELRESVYEIQDFLELCTPHSGLIDIGAHTGFISALFAQSRRHASHILSVEPDENVFSLLSDARALNVSDHLDWSILRAVVGVHSGEISFSASGSNAGYSKGAMAPQTCRSATLAEIVNELHWRPDILKIDVESFEHEIISNSMDLIDNLRPALQLEVHWRMLRDRDLDPFKFLTPLADIGYRGLRRRYRTLEAWRRLETREAVSRLSLHT